MTQPLLMGYQPRSVRGYRGRSELLERRSRRESARGTAFSMSDRFPAIPTAVPRCCRVRLGAPTMRSGVGKVAQTQPRLLERDGHLQYLLDVVDEAVEGQSSTVLISGAAGIGKSSLLRTLLGRLPDVRVLRGGCDDWLAPSPLQPIRDAFRGSRGPVERALGNGLDSGALLGAVVEELDGTLPVVLIVEDVHWADDATIDLLKYLARQPNLGVVLLLTYRDDEVDTRHPLRGLLGALRDTRIHRITLEPLSVDAVRIMSAGTGRDAEELHALTGGNPFYLTEALAGPVDDVPATVVDAVLARVRRLDPETIRVVEQLSVVPIHLALEEAECLVDNRLDELMRAQESGVIQAHGDGIGFSHELARRAVEQAMPTIRRIALNAHVVRCLLRREEPALSGLVHHAVEARDAENILRYTPTAAKRATDAGSHHQALKYYEAAMPYLDRLPVAERADLLERYAWELHIAHRLPEAVRVGQEAVNLFEDLDLPVAFADTLLRQARFYYLAGDTNAAVAGVERAVTVAEQVGCPNLRAATASHHGMMLVLTGDPRTAIPALQGAHALAVEADRTDLMALCTSYLGLALSDIGQTSGLEHLRTSIRAAISTGDYEVAARGYTNLAQILYRQCRWDELADCLLRGREFIRERGFGSHAFNLDVHEALLVMRRGDWREAEDRLLRLIDSIDGVSVLSVTSTSSLGRLLARRADPQAEALLSATWDMAREQRSLPGLADAAIGYAEWAWLNGRRDIATAIRDDLAAWPNTLGAPAFGELLRYLARAGVDVTPAVGGSAGYQFGVRGDWRAAAATWEMLGDPYERALEMVESGEVEATSLALQILDGLGASRAVTLVRNQLRELGVSRLPRQLRARTRTNPGQLTDRQIDVLTLLADGLTNAEIAEKLAVSVRTVDHHVAAILSRLNAPTRRDAAATARSIGLLQDKPPHFRLA